MWIENTLNKSYNLSSVILLGCKFEKSFYSRSSAAEHPIPSRTCPLPTGTCVSTQADV